MSRLHLHPDRSSHLCRDDDCGLMIAESDRRRYQRIVALLAAAPPPLVGSVVYAVSSEPWYPLIAAGAAACFGGLFYAQFCGHGDRSFDR